jgi:hypothetical protein
METALLSGLSFIWPGNIRIAQIAGIVLVIGYPALGIASDDNSINAMRDAIRLMKKELEGQDKAKDDQSRQTTSQQEPLPPAISASSQSPEISGNAKSDSGQRTPCNTCPIRIAPPIQTMQELKEAESATHAASVMHDGPDKAFQQWQTDQLIAGKGLSRSASASLKQNGISCADITEAKASSGVRRVIEKNAFLARKHHDPNQFRQNIDAASFSVGVVQQIYKVIADASPVPPVQYCIFADEDILRGAIEAYAPLAYHNYQIMRQLTAERRQSATAGQVRKMSPAQSHPMQAAFDRLGRNKCDKWASSQGGEWLNATVDMSANLADRGVPRKFWGNITAGSTSELAVHFGGGGSVGALSDLVYGGGAQAASNMVIKITSKTKMLSRNLRVNGELIGYGRQIGTRDIRLTNGAKSTAAVIEASCLE